MFKLLTITLLAVSATGCATHTYTSPVNGQQVVLRGDAAEFRNNLKDPAYVQSFDAKGPAPQIWHDIVNVECRGNLDIKYKSDRTYWILRTNPQNAGKDDRELALTRARFCQDLQAVGKK